MAKTGDIIFTQRRWTPPLHFLIKYFFYFLPGFPLAVDFHCKPNPIVDLSGLSKCADKFLMQTHPCLLPVQPTQALVCRKKWKIQQINDRSSVISQTAL